MATRLLPLLGDHDLTVWSARDRRAPPDQVEVMDIESGRSQGRREATSLLDRQTLDRLQAFTRLPLGPLLRAGRQDLLYSPDYSAPPLRSRARIVTVHDIAWRVRPEFTPGGLARYLDRTVEREIGSGSSIVTVSNASAQDIVHAFQVDPGRITVVPNGVDERFFSAQPLGVVEKAALGLPDRYVLMVGTIEPRKNHQAVLKALPLVRDSMATPVVIAGARGWHWEPVLAAMRPFAADGRVVYLDYVDDSLLPSMYAGAEATLYPSWYEGFGLPILESLATGTPVIASSSPASREVAGELAVYCEPDEPETIAAGIELAIAPEMRDARLVELRKSRAREYDWESSARALAQLIVTTGEAVT